MNIIFAGTPDFAKYILTTLHKNHNIVGVFCQPDRPKGRGKKITACAVKIYAIANNIPVYQPEKIGNNEQEIIQKSAADIMIVVAFGQILPANILNITPKGCLNIHTSLLPRWRGAAPIQRAIESGDTKTGVCVMQMDEGLDTGDVLLSKTCEISQEETTQTLYHKLITLSQTTILETLSQLDTLKPNQQNHTQATYAHKLTKQEAWIDWNQTATQIHQKIRAFNPYPITQTQAIINEKSQILRIIESNIIDNKTPFEQVGEVIKQDKNQLHISTKQGVIALKTVQIHGKKPTQIQAFNNAYSLQSFFKKNKGLN